MINFNAAYVLGVMLRSIQKHVLYSTNYMNRLSQPTPLHSVQFSVSPVPWYKEFKTIFIPAPKLKTDDPNSEPISVHQSFVVDDPLMSTTTKVRIQSVLFVPSEFSAFQKSF